MRKTIALVIAGLAAATFLGAPVASAQNCSAPGENWVKNENSKAGDRTWNQGAPFR